MTLVGSIPRIAHSDAVDDELLGHLVADLRAAVGPGRASAEPLELALYARGAGVPSERPVCASRSTDEVAAAVRVAAARPAVRR
jgi:hypothetical protein